MTQFTRRTLIKGAAGTVGAASLTATQVQLAYAAHRALYTQGTTLEQVATPKTTSGYTRLMAGPGYALTVRQDLAAAKPSRDNTRTALASFVQFTDLHLIDAQSPVRFEWLTTVNSSAFRPHESMGTHGAAQLVKRVNELKKGPFSGRAFDCVVSTGDNTDNHEHVELDWFFAVMNGGSITQNTGDAKKWEGVQTGGDKTYYNVQSSMSDRYKDAGFPLISGFFNRVIASHSSPGLNTKWFSVFGNHDDSVSGVLPSDWGALAAMYTGDKKFMGFASSASNAALQSAVTNGSASILGQSPTPKSTWRVTPDSRRKPFTPVEYMQAHLPSGGHGFTQNNIDTGNGYYAFTIADGVTGIAMDSTNRAGFTDGSLGDEQFTWLQKRLAQGSSRYYDVWGIEQKHSVSDELFVLFSHHTSDSMGNLLMDPAKLEIRHGGLELVNTIKRFPNVLAWVNGHTHVNKITAQKHNDARRSFWEINTASHVDFPQHARIIDVMDNADGTLSLFTTLIESAAPYEASYTDGSQAALGSVYREMSYNDLSNDNSRVGGAGDHNTELLLTDPRR